jgi:nitronate monooxygenase
VLRTLLTQRLGIAHPIISAPMGIAGGGALAAAVSEAGGLGLIGGGYGDERWLRAQIKAAGSSRVGCGLLIHAVRKQPHCSGVSTTSGTRTPVEWFGQ